MFNAFIKSKSGRPPKGDPHTVGPLQKEILREILTHPSEAHGVGIARALRREHDPELPDAQVYVALRRLEARGIIELARDVDEQNSPSLSNGRRGRPRKLYALTMSGKRAITGAAENSKSGPGQTSYIGEGHGKQRNVGTPA